MLKALFLDFYGTLAQENGPVIQDICRRIAETGGEAPPRSVARFWGGEFQALLAASHGDSFQTQRRLELASLRRTLTQFGSAEDPYVLSELLYAYWRRPPLFDETAAFFEQAPYPVYIVSNIDTAEIEAAVSQHRLHPAGVFTSEDAQSYKPRRELFDLALRRTGLQPGEVWHVGNSFSCDIRGAAAVEIPAVWLNRGGKPAPSPCWMLPSLRELLEVLSSGT